MNLTIKGKPIREYIEDLDPEIKVLMAIPFGIGFQLVLNKIKNKRTMQLPTLEDATDILVDVANELGKALEDGKVQVREYWNLGLPLLRLPKVLDDKEDFMEDLQVFIKDADARIAVVTRMQARFDIPQEIAELVVKRTLDYYFSTEMYIEDIKQLVKGEIPNYLDAEKSTRVSGIPEIYEEDLSSYTAGLLKAYSSVKRKA